MKLHEIYNDDEHEPMDVEDLLTIQQQVYDFYDKVKRAGVLSRKEDKDIRYWITQYERAYDSGNSETTDEAITMAAKLLARAKENHRLDIEAPDYINDILY